MTQLSEEQKKGISATRIMNVLDDLRGHFGPGNCWCDGDGSDESPHLFCCSATEMLYRELRDATSDLTAMTLSPCNTPAQGFNTTREKKVATAMRDKCVEKAREYLTDCRDEERGIIEAIAAELSALTLDQVKPGEK